MRVWSVRVHCGGLLMSLTVQESIDVAVATLTLVYTVEYRQSAPPYFHVRMARKRGRADKR